MRIAYVSLHWPRTKNSGVGRKIIDQMAAWRQHGHTVQFFSHHNDVNDIEALVDGTNIIYQAPKGIVGRPILEINRCLAASRLVNALREYSPDLIYLRWSMYVFPSHRMFQIAPVVVEINTNDVTQHKMLGPVLSTYNRLTRGIYYSKASGLVFVSGELIKSNEFTSFSSPKRVIPNAINLSENLPLEAPKNERPRLGFIGTPDIPWQGVDKLVRLAELCPELDVDVIGFDSLEGWTKLPPNLYLHGYLSKKEAREILAGVDVGMGTLALHRKAMNETSALKTCEYLAYGIPIILPYEETSLVGVNLDTILRIPNTEDNIETSWESIRDFAFSMRGKRVKPEQIAPFVGSEFIESERLNFFIKCIDGYNKSNEK